LLLLVTLMMAAVMGWFWAALGKITSADHQSD
jgi:hypothetical protein